MKYKPTIGLEIHAELKTKTKMFCDSLNLPTQIGDSEERRPNTNVCPVCMGHPGTLPTINKEAIDKIIKVGLALNCEIASFSKFDRKHYFYPDLPKGYQISQYDMPICIGGGIEIEDGKVIHLERIHMEEDAGTLKHEGVESLADYNRAGVPLMELVTKPEIHTPEDVEKFARELQLILRYLNASDANMEKGQMRVEVNLSLSPEDSDKLGTKVEVKNIGSINSAMRAAKYEINRQAELLESGEKIDQETRGWDDVKDRSFSQRSKEEAKDYRYFPEPDLPPLRLTKEYIESLRVQLPELPSGRRKRFKRIYGLNDIQIESFTSNKYLGDYFESVASEIGSWDNVKHGESKGEEHKYNLYILASNYIITDLARIGFDESQKTNVTPENFAELIIKIYHKELSSSAGKTVLEDMVISGKDPDEIIKEKNLGQISDAGDLSNAVDDVINANPKAVEDYRSGKEAPIKFLVGKVMAETKGRANPEVVLEMLKKKLS